MNVHDLAVMQLTMKGYRMLNLKEIKHTIGLIKTAGNVMDERIHSTGVSIINHANECGDWTQVNALYQALPKSARRVGFVEWVVAFTPLKFDDKAKVFLRAKSSKKAYDVEGAEATPFWDFTVEHTSALNVDTLLVIEKLIEQAQKKLVKAQEDGREIKGDMAKFESRVIEFEQFAAA
jgi:hypothetical protein